MKTKKVFGRITATIMAVILICTTAVMPAGAASATPLPTNCVIGYWENWTGSNACKLRDVDPRWDVIIVSFMLTDSTGSVATFEVDDSLYPGSTRNEDFKADVKYCQDRGQKVLISFGGAVGYSLSIDSTAQRDSFLNSARDIIETYGFDGFDVDIEMHILNVGNETSMNKPTKPMNVNLIYILHQLADYFGDSFMLTMAPEHPYVQGGAFTWGGWNNIYGGYLPLLDNVRDILTFIHPQYYNNSISYTGISGYNANSLVSLSEMLINGFTAKNGEKFAGLRPDQVAMGVLVGESASSGTMATSVYQDAFRRMLQKYPDFRGMMTWSLNIDENSQNKSFLNGMCEVIDQYGAQDPLSITSLTADKSGTVNAGTSVTWTAATANANGTVSYKFDLLRDGAAFATNTGAASSYTATLTQAGTYTLKVTATDSSSSATATWDAGITVIAPLSITSVTPNAQNTTFTVNTTGGEGGNLYSYYFLKGGKVFKATAFSSSNQITFNASESGTYSLRVYVQDRTGTRVVKAITVTV